MTRLRIAIGVALLCIAYGACFLLEGQPARHISWPRYLGLALVGGLVLLASELVSDLLTRNDQVGDPTLRRAGRLLGLFVLVGVASGILWAVWTAL